MVWPVILLTIVAVLSACGDFAGPAGAAERAAGLEFVGEVFGRPVAASEFAYYTKTASLFTLTGLPVEERTDEAVRREAWQDLLFIHEADRLGIDVSRAEIEAQISRLLAQQGVVYGSPEYVDWVAVALQEDVETFERRVETLLRIQELLKWKLDPEVAVSQQDVDEWLFRQHNALAGELLAFQTRAGAEAFLAALQREPSIWPGGIRISLMTAGAIMDIWQIPEEDLQRLLRTDSIGTWTLVNSDYGPAVFWLLAKQSAPPETFAPVRRQRCLELLQLIKKRQAASAYLDDLLRRARYRDYALEQKQDP